ncbi:hypothetical protein Acr_18g0000810 [Actinidia rufa]|uniref:Secreted protein n=1 Tax=Actinidia rufa TaxID=165716 RepID=A0A7J0G543_9ERIC|nr:hypothetical protein Acr_18g0000810 [Actinidia rufa]
MSWWCFGVVSGINGGWLVVSEASQSFDLLLVQLWRWYHWFCFVKIKPTAPPTIDLCVSGAWCSQAWLLSRSRLGGCVHSLEYLVFGCSVDGPECGSSSVGPLWAGPSSD